MSNFATRVEVCGAIIPVRAAIRLAIRIGFDPYNNHGAVVRAYARLCQQRGAVTIH